MTSDLSMDSPKTPKITQTKVRLFRYLFWLLCLSLGFCTLPARNHIQAQSPAPDTRFGLVQTFDDFDAAAELRPGFTRIKL